MKKKIFIALILLIIAVIAGVLLWGGSSKYFSKEKKDNYGCLVSEGYSWCEKQQKCLKKEECLKLDEQAEIFESIKSIIGLGLELSDQIVMWNSKEKGEASLDGKGYYWTDLLHSEKMLKVFENIDGFLKQNGFAGDNLNVQKDFFKKYRKEDFIANVKIIDNSNGTSSLTIALADINAVICDFNSECGKECNVDSDCRIFLDGCNRMTVCRNKNYKFYDNCANPSSAIQDIEFKIQNCQCTANKCAYKKPEL